MRPHDRGIRREPGTATRPGGTRARGAGDHERAHDDNALSRVGVRLRGGRRRGRRGPRAHPAPAPRRALRRHPGSVAAARAVTTRFLHRLGAEWCARVPERTTGDLHLVVSELATNAERHAGGFHALELTGDATHVVVTVHDTSPVAPTFLRPDPARVGGHGLEIVRALSREVRIARTPGGKSVGAVVDLPH
ncbi:Anti-sigma regulatory factor (Ser/Thr protein kinase) [Streptomyces sp. SolWspMP-sol7th]|uniref:ATP-binding protein n=1 Tax=Streptomyces sp. SolWspMP-sol7th TaxID=1839776 RepID=UPI00081DB936|nr:ATP-binding protein [Streptomyces sp. SolWspMP-sol7th]SCE30867.1 Anti-sigma regulatory factor (Ser/Thr protein kinase) [Streptomyces sp. SolWspMP-sol7th]